MSPIELAIQLLQELLGQQQWSQVFTVLAGITGNTVDILYELSGIQQGLLAEANTLYPLLNNVLALEQANGQLLNQLINGKIQVSLPPVPPPAYVPPSPGDNAVGVWNYILPTSGVRAADALAIAGLFPTNLTDAYIAFPGADVPYVSMYVNWESGYPIQPASSVTAADPHLILPTDANILAFLNRIDGAGTWALGPEGFPYQNGLPGSGGQQYVYTMGEADFLAWQGVNAAAARVAPVWPGIANVTLGATVALADGLTVPGPLDGLIVKITGVAPPIGYYAFGTYKSFVRAGGVVFFDDNGEGEYAQPIAGQDQVICPLSMQQADHAILRLKSGVTGTVTPWTAL